MIARRDWTNQWWTHARDRDELVTSEAVLNELGRGGHPRRGDCLALVSGLKLLPIDGAIAETIEGYLSHRLMPRDPLGDALHLALASHHRCDFLASGTAATSPTRTSSTTSVE